MSAQKTSAHAWSTDFGLLLIRIMLAVVFMFHGSQKLFGWFEGPGFAATGEFMGKINLPMPAVSAFLAAATEFFGGAALLLGVLVRLVVLPMAFAMFVAAFVVHGGVFSVQQGGMEYPLTLAIILLALGLTGGGRVGLDRVLWRRGRRRA